MTLLDRVPRSLPLAVALGCLMVAPTLNAGLVMDDVLIRTRLLGAETAWGPAPWWDLYTFARPDQNDALRAAGFHPWWADPAVKMTFFRPLSAATHAVDHALWPDVPVLHHLHSVLWYGLAVAAAGVLLRRMMPAAPRTAALAALLFAVASPHATMVGWVAARNTMISFVLGCGLIALHAAGRRRAALVVLAVGFLSGEAILGALAYVAAWELCRGSRPLRALLPYAVVVVVWRLLYTAAGFGAQACGIYHDPGSDLAGFLAAAAGNLPVLLLSQWLLVPLDAWAVLPRAAQVGMLGAAAVALPLVGWVLRPRLRRHAEDRAWALGMVLSLVPFTATMPMDRLLLFGSLGAAALLARAADARPGRALAALLVLHLPVSALLGLVRSATVAQGVAMFNSGLHQAPDDEDVAGQTFVYLAGTFHRVHYTTLMRQTTGSAAVPRRSVVLTSMVTGARLTREDADTLVVRPDGGFLRVDLDRIHRQAGARLAVGDVVSLPDLDVEVRALTPDGRPAEAAFHFRVPLEDPSLRWLVVRPAGGAFPPAVQTLETAPPAVGETVELTSVFPYF